MRRLAAMMLSVAMLLPATADADRVVAALSQNRVAITSGFEGLEILVYGAIAHPGGTTDPDLGVVVSIVGPYEPVTIRRKQRVAGLWINTESEHVAGVPSFHAVASTGPIDGVLDATENERWRVSIYHAMRWDDAGESLPDPSFVAALVRLRQQAGLYIAQPGGVSVEQGMLFRAQIPLPSNIVEGIYTANVLLTRERRVVDSYGSTILVRKAGLERMIHDTAINRPLIYGVLSILVALAAGFAASEVFRYFRR